MIFIWLMACGDGTPSNSQGPQNQPLGPGEQPVQEIGQPSDEAPPSQAEAERPVPAEERDGENGRIALSASVVCDSPRASSAPLLEFKRNTLPNQESESWRAIASEEPFGHENGAIAVLDFNNDGWDDIVTAVATGIFAYVNNGKGGFEIRSDWFGGVETESITGLAAGDFDNDGLVDLYLTQFMASDTLLRNTGEVFEKADLGISTKKTISGGASWMDFDGDGDLDIFVSSHGAGPEGEFTDKPKLAKADTNFLYENTGSKFRSLSSKLSYGGKEPYTFNGLWLPLDDKQGFDLYLVNDFGSFVTPNLVLSNQGSFKPLQNTGLELEMYSTSGSVSDWNSDGVPDILVSGIGAPALLMSENGKWSNKASEMGIPENPNRTTSWGAAIFDMDNDGDDDIWMATGPIFFPENDGSFPNAEKQTDGIFLYENGAFTEASWADKTAKNSRSAVTADLNRDGFWDVVVNPIDGPVEVYWGSCDGSSFIDVRLEDSKGNQAGLGATVEVKAGDTTWTRWMTSGVGFGSSGPTELHFGLGTRSQVDSITVTWADGEQSVFLDVPTKRKLVISR